MESLSRHCDVGNMEGMKRHNFLGKTTIPGGSLEDCNLQFDGNSAHITVERRGQRIR